MKTVYLSGPITGLTYAGATDWRKLAIEELAKHGIIGVSPMRAKDYLAGLKEPISGHGRDYVHMGVLSTPQAVVARDRYDTQRVDLVLMNLLGAKQVSIGTMVELGWADAARVPVIGIIEPEGNAHDHMFVSQLIGFRVEELEQGLSIVKAILSNETSAPVAKEAAGTRT